MATTSLSDYSISRQGSSASNNAIRTQRTPHEPNSSSSRGRSGRTGRGRGKYKGGTKTSNPTYRDFDKVPQEVANSGVPSEESSAQEGNLEASNDDSVSSKGYRHDGRVGNGKYRQRRNISRLLDGPTTLDGLDVDLAESIVPTEQTSARVGESSRNRHPTNNRKVNLTHLLNYKFESKHRNNRHQMPYSYTEGGVNQHRNASSHYRDPGTAHKFSKQQFLQANCQFVVLDGHDYSVHKADPDWPVDWDCIEEVRFKQSASTETSCPVCLEPPVAAKITRCGHIYCWTCILHYLSLSDENCRQCPICFEPVYKSDLRSVISHSYMNYSVGDEIVMRLMIRKKGCVEVEPYKGERTIASESEYTLSSPDPTDHYSLSQANLVIVDSSTVITKIAHREHNELSIKLETDRDEPEVCFIEQALGLLRARVEKLRSRVANRPPEVARQSTPTSPKPNSSKSYLFYQCSDGQHIYLNPFSTKTLCHEHESLENCPLEIKAKILQMDWISMSEAWRRRFRYLEHLPLTCEFRLIEIDFEGSNLISDETYQVFEDQIKRRELEREKRRREERKREKIIQVEQNRKIYGIQPSLKINLDNIDQFPSVSDERYLGLSQPRNQSRISEGLSSDDNEPEDPSRNTDGNLDQTVQAEPSEENIAPIDDHELSKLALSFKEIQLQQLASSSTSSAKHNTKPNVAGSWASKSQGCSSNQSASFANLLVNAKSSHKEWTRNVTSSATTNTTGAPNYKQGTSVPAPSSDDGVEELRAPPSDFTISDFIDMNIVSSAKKKGKLKRLAKKG